MQCIVVQDHSMLHILQRKLEAQGMGESIWFLSSPQLALEHVLGDSPQLLVTGIYNNGLAIAAKKKNPRCLVVLFTSHPLEEEKPGPFYDGVLRKHDDWDNLMVTNLLTRACATDDTDDLRGKFPAVFPGSRAP